MLIAVAETGLFNDGKNIPLHAAGQANFWEALGIMAAKKIQSTI